MSGAKAYIATEHEFGDAFQTPARHSLNPEDGGGENWKVVREDFHEHGVRLLWECELTRSLQTVRPPSKFHPAKPKPKPSKKPKPKAVTMKAAPLAPVAAAPKPAVKEPEKAKETRPNGAPKVATGAA